MFHFSNAKVNTCCNSSVPCTEADSCCSRSQENTVLALIMDAIIMASIFVVIISIIMGLRLTEAEGNNTKAYAGAIDLLLELRSQAKKNKDWATSDKIRNELTALGFVIKDTKDGAEWSLGN